MLRIAAVVAVLTVAAEVAGLFPTHRQCHIEITNKSSKYSLTNPSVHVDSGSCAKSFPLTIDSSGTGDALFTKTPYTARGAAGVFTYDLLDRSTNEATEKIAVMFSVPYDFNMYSNWYAVGIFDKSKECNYDLFHQMYNHKDNSFVRSKASGSALKHENDRVTVMASMMDSYQPDMKVEVSDNWNTRIEK